MVRYCAQITKDMWDAEKAEALMSRAAELVDQAASGNFHRDHVRTEPFTDQVRKACGV
jgi:hypothetical protein